ncbi:MAG: formate dehydrogenase accessory sulfurtransferase FdhD [Saprospiraceae bacterium]|nr:formate dehydrogenase accessory sulfurtransferase FdhD [Saprospiraceae bacterium]
MNGTKNIRLRKFKDHNMSVMEDMLAVEEPLEIRLVYGPIENRIRKSISVTMRTPGHDEWLALGFLKNEGVISQISDVLKVSFTTYHKGELNPNIITVSLKPGYLPDLSDMERNFYATSSCGICGKASIEAVQSYCMGQVSTHGQPIPISILSDLPSKLREAQMVFNATGGLHAAACFDQVGTLIMHTEDVGRHNAMDKISGCLLQSNKLHDIGQYILLLSGRASFELIQKAAMTGFPIVCAVGAPSSLAVETAEATGITLIGFLKQTSCNVYSHPQRIQHS